MKQLDQILSAMPQRMTQTGLRLSSLQSLSYQRVFQTQGWVILDCFLDLVMRSMHPCLSWIRIQISPNLQLFLRFLTLPKWGYHWRLLIRRKTSIKDLSQAEVRRSRPSLNLRHRAHKKASKKSLARKVWHSRKAALWIQSMIQLLKKTTRSIIVSMIQQLWIEVLVKTTQACPYKTPTSQLRTAL